MISERQGHIDKLLKQITIMARKATAYNRLGSRLDRNNAKKSKIVYCYMRVYIYTTICMRSIRQLQAFLEKHRLRVEDGFFKDMMHRLRVEDGFFKDMMLNKKWQLINTNMQNQEDLDDSLCILYLRKEHDQQKKRMKKLGLNVDEFIFEQNVNTMLALAENSPDKWREMIEKGTFGAANDTSSAGGLLSSSVGQSPLDKEEVTGSNPA